ncbi:hypothetical protein [Pontibacter kalidii]|uniref:hypothetical protein n=1 Tax=Pontibacter kalidii TaxID=2592049 RepID=UPI00225A443E|nr:hypothetical protein [Pontibacter kalidii]
MKPQLTSITWFSWQEAVAGKGLSRRLRQRSIRFGRSINVAFADYKSAASYFRITIPKEREICASKVGKYKSTTYCGSGNPQ